MTGRRHRSDADAFAADDPGAADADADAVAADAGAADAVAAVVADAFVADVFAADTTVVEPPVGGVPLDAAVAPATARSRLSLFDLIDESILGISAKPARLVLTMIGTVVGIGALVATLGLGQTAAGQIAQRFDEVTATRVVLSANNPGFNPDQSTAAALPWDAADRVARLNGVAAAATYSPVNLGSKRVSGVNLIDPSGSNLLDIPVVGTSERLLETEGGDLVVGRFFDAGHDQRADPVVVLGAGAAERLSINRVDARPSIFIGETAFAVIGVIDGVGRRDDCWTRSSCRTARRRNTSRSPRPVSWTCGPWWAPPSRSERRLRSQCHRTIPERSGRQIPPARAAVDVGAR